MFYNLVISGGSTKTIAVIGSLMYLQDKHMIDNIVNVVGTSAGSILGFLIVLGYTPAEISDIMKKEFIGGQHHHLDYDELLNFTVLESFGLDSGSRIIEFLSNQVEKKLGKTDVTFVELAKLSGKNLVVCVANLTKQRSEYLCVDSTPHLDVIQAVRMSISIPVLFTPVRYNGDMFLDGALYECLPIGYMNSFKDTLKDTLAINTTGIVKHNLDNIGGFFGCILDSLVTKANHPKEISNKIVMFDIDFEGVDMLSIDIETMSFEIDAARIEENIRMGYNAIKRLFEK
jgi:predicted acylesterase/phospholipase RssA